MSEGTVFSGRYEVQRWLARGTIADIYLARDQLLDRAVAVKVFNPEFTGDPTFVEQFRRQAQSATNLTSPDIVSVFDWGEEEETYFIVMEYVEGRSLEDIISAEGPLHPQRAAEVASDIAAALGFAHRSGVIHGDVKPANVLIATDGKVKVTAFGVASALDPTPEPTHGLPLDPGSDLYALGCLLYESVTGRSPFNGQNPVATAFPPAQEQLVAPRAINPNVPPELDAIILKQLAMNPAARYESADEVRADLRRFLEGQPVLAAGAMAATAATQAVPVTAETAAYTPPPEETKKRSPVMVAAMIGGGVLLALLLFGVARAVTGGGGSRNTVELTVPTGLVNQPQAQAQQALETAGFEVTVTTAQNDQIADGLVVSVNPAESTKVSVDKGTKGKATLVVSAGAATEPMPPVTGQQADTAVSFLRSQGFTNVTATAECQPAKCSSKRRARANLLPKTPRSR
jgi:serine/threonine-protein kinase